MEHNVAMIPAVLAGIVKQLEAIDGWLTLKTEPVLNGTIGLQEDWIDIYELRRMIPGDPKIELVRSWLYFHGIPTTSPAGLPSSAVRRLMPG